MLPKCHLNFDRKSKKEKIRKKGIINHWTFSLDKWTIGKMINYCEWEIENRLSLWRAAGKLPTKFPNEDSALISVINRWLNKQCELHQTRYLSRRDNTDKQKSPPRGLKYFRAHPGIFSASRCGRLQHRIANSLVFLPPEYPFTSVQKPQDFRLRSQNPEQDALPQEADLYCNRVYVEDPLAVESRRSKIIGLIIAHLARPRDRKSLLLSREIRKFRALIAYQS